MLVVDAMVGLLEQEFGCRPSEFIARLGDRAEGHSGRGCVLDVVVADDGDVIGNPKPRLREVLEETERDEVVGAERSGGPAIPRVSEQALAGEPSVGEAEPRRGQ